MFNPEKILGGLISSGMKRKPNKGFISGGVALGLLGVAMEAVDHFMKQPQPQPQPSASPPSMGPSLPPPLPPPGKQPASLATAMPPPPPSANAAAAVSTPAADSQQETVLLIRAMIAAANADGVIDASERAAILERLKTADLTADEHAFIVHELLAPKDVEQIVAAVTSPTMASHVYSASLMAIEVDTEVERAYLQTLALRLNLDETTIGAIHRQCGLEPL